ncbi:MAG: hypothetical protein ACRC3Y_17400 [Romboutsia sp.]|uniref:hypothetical protein n=1 Tax=Romboutsia sp. TaxID=1965302 RepID=UPI003F38D822
MKKIINLLSFFLVINILVLGNLLLVRYNNNLNIIPVSYAKSSNDNNDNYNLIVKILKDTNKNNFIQYAEYININFISTIPNAPDNKVAFILSLPQKVSFIAFYDQISSNNYKFSFVIDNLTNIDNIYYYKNFLVIEQNENNSASGFIERNYLEIFYKIEDKYQSVFNRNTYSSKLLKDNSNNLQFIENASIDFLEGDSSRILCVTTTIVNKEKLSLLNNSKEYIEIKKDTKKEIYKWNLQNSKFEIEELN